jgi:hypothetical protein
MYPQDILPIHPEAVQLLRIAHKQAMRIGLYPKFGNPFWFRSQKFRPKAYQENCDPTTYDTKKTVEHFAFNFVQTDRIRQYFKSFAEAHKAAPTQGGATAEHRQQGNFYTDDNLPLAMHRDHVDYHAKVEFSIKNPTVPGLMSTQGMKKKFHNLYSATSKKRMGFSNPVLGIKKV